MDKGRRIKRIAAAILGVMVVAGLVGWAATAMHGGSASSSAPAPASPGLGFGGAGGGTAQGGAVDARAPEGGVGTVAGTRSNVQAIGPDIIKQASIRLQVRKGSFADRFEQAVSVASTNGGFVETSDTSVGRFRSGYLTVRVPADRFEAALAQLKGLGTVKATKVSGQDVTAQVVDLQAQLRNWRAQEVVLLRLMSKATTIADSIKVQQQLQSVQGTIEELQGQIGLLADQTAMSTITVSMTEAGPVAPAPARRPPLVRAWHSALDGFVNVIASVVVGLGYLVPVGLILLAAWLGWRGARRAQRRRHPAVAAAS